MFSSTCTVSLRSGHESVMREVSIGRGMRDAKIHSQESVQVGRVQCGVKINADRFVSPSNRIAQAHRTLEEGDMIVCTRTPDNTDAVHVQ